MKPNTRRKFSNTLHGRQTQRNVAFVKVFNTAIYHLKPFSFLSVLIFLAWIQDTDYAVARVRRTTCQDDVTEQPRAGEFLNDAVAYEWPDTWQEIWDTTTGNASARISAGSLDAREFLYLEELRFQAAPATAPLWLFLTREHRELGQDESVNHELSLAFPQISNWLVPSLLTDSDSNKKWSDLGFALGTRKSITEFSEIYFWSTDHYYNSKASYQGIDAGKWLVSPYSWGIRHATPDRTAVISHFSLEIDTPSRFESPELTCEYRALTLRARGAMPVANGLLPTQTLENIRWRVAIDRHEKSIDGKSVERTSVGGKSIEAKSSNSKSLDGANKETQRLTTEVSLHWREKNGTPDARGYWTMGALWHKDAIKVTGQSGTAHSRQELVLSSRYTFLSVEDIRPFLGFVGSYGNRSGDLNSNNDNSLSSETIEQLKLQTGFLIPIVNRNATNSNKISGAFRTLANWDVDHLVTDYPYKKHHLRPWDGGLLQFSLFL